MYMSTGRCALLRGMVFVQMAMTEIVWTFANTFEI